MQMRVLLLIRVDKQQLFKSDSLPEYLNFDITLNSDQHYLAEA